ncbi:hypothetical protein [Mangrovicoccus sp. HB161399]|uniref:hypothetical protein n=1 Tax=Mangrovicoccus sp. HB161399 TaxID=2720392 RepID=UPI00155219E7|nr:hypothetical protein [Mangrovicoccus sp. HB161399]
MERIVPEGAVTFEDLTRTGLGREQAEAAMARLSGVANQCILTREEQQQRAEVAKRAWLDTRSEEFRERHLLTDWPGLADPAQLALFHGRREEALLERMALQPAA